MRIHCDSWAHFLDSAQNFVFDGVVYKHTSQCISVNTILSEYKSIETLQLALAVDAVRYANVMIFTLITLLMGIESFDLFTPVNWLFGTQLRCTSLYNHVFWLMSTKIPSCQTRRDAADKKQRTAVSATILLCIQNVQSS